METKNRSGALVVPGAQQFKEIPRMGFPVPQGPPLAMTPEQAYIQELERQVAQAQGTGRMKTRAEANKERLLDQARTAGFAEKPVAAMNPSLFFGVASHNSADTTIMSATNYWLAKNSRMGSYTVGSKYDDHVLTNIPVDANGDPEYEFKFEGLSLVIENIGSALAGDVVSQLRHETEFEIRFGKSEDSEAIRGSEIPYFEDANGRVNDFFYKFHEPMWITKENNAGMLASFGPEVVTGLNVATSTNKGWVVGTVLRNVTLYAPSGERAGQ